MSFHYTCYIWIAIDQYRFYNEPISLIDLRNESNFFRVIEVSTGKRTENVCNNALRALMQFSVIFWLIPRSTKKH